MPKPRDPNDTTQDDQDDALDETLQEDEGQDEGLDPADETGDAGAEEGEDEGADEAEAVDAAPRRPNRAQSRIQTLSQQVRDSNERSAKLERELLEFKAQQTRQAAAPPQETPEARAVRRATLAPEEIMREDLRESEGRTQTMLQTMMMQNRDTADRTAYAEVLRESPALKKYAADVDRIHGEEIAKGNFINRAVLLDLVIGRAAREAAKVRTPGGKTPPRRQPASQATQPARSRGDTATTRGRQGNDLESRLKDVPI